jgi:hypothetical protein
MQSSPIYWHLKRRREFLEFEFKKGRFKARSLRRDSAKTISIFGQLIRIIILRLLICIILVFALAAFDDHLGTWSPSWLHLSLDKEAQRDFFAALAVVSAAFLTLYFTAISVVVSTAYARTPGNIRSLIIKEEVGSAYFGCLAQFAGVVTVMLTFLAFGHPIGPLNTLLTSSLCLFSIFGFTFLGVRAFEYFDPTALVSLLNRRVFEEFQSVTPDGYQWTDQSFQRHHQGQAEELLRSYADLVTVASQKENLEGKGLVEVGRGLLRVLSIYAREKIRIPSSSFWFKRSYRHKNWLLTSHSELEIALVTGTIIQPDTVPDLLWFETDAARTLENIFHILGEQRDSAGTIALTTTLHDHLGRMSQHLAVPEALQIYRAVVPDLRAQSGNMAITANEAPSKAMDRLGIAELYSCALIQIVLGLSKQLEELNPETLETIIELTDWLQLETLYTHAILPRAVIEEMESLRDRFEFETRIEGRLITPKWLHKEMLALGFVRFLKNVSSELVEEFEVALGTETETQLAANNYVLVAQLVQRGLEACDKLSRQFFKFKKLHEGYAALNRSKEYEFPAIDWDALQGRIAVLHQRLVTTLAKSSHDLAKIPESEIWPDFFGHAYTVLGEECFNAMASGNEELFRVVFPHFFDLVLQANERLRQKFQNDAKRIALCTDPLADLMSVSGFAAVFSELDKKTFWGVVEQCWNSYFALYSDESKKQQFIKLLCFAVEPTLAITPRSVMRTRWQQMCGRVLRTRGVISDRAFSHYQRLSSNHPSRLIRVFTHSEYLLTDADDVFLHCTFSNAQNQLALKSRIKSIICKSLCNESPTMNASHLPRMSKRHSVQPIRRQRAIFYDLPSIAERAPQFYMHMFPEDVSLGIMPIGGRSSRPDFKVKISPANEGTEKIIMAGLNARQYQGSLADELYEFFRLLAAELCFAEKAIYEIVYLEEPETEKIIGFELAFVNQKQVIEVHGQPYQIVPAEVAKERHLPELIPLLREELIVFKPPRDFEQPLCDVRENLSELDRFQFPGIMLEAMEKKVPYDFRTHDRSRKLALVEAVKPIGWNARGAFNSCVLSYYWIHLMLRFERFKIQLRNAMLAELNDGLKRVGQKIGFESKITIDGLPTEADVDNAIANLSSGTMAFTDVMKPFEMR